MKDDDNFFESGTQPTFFRKPRKTTSIVLYEGQPHKKDKTTLNNLNSTIIKTMVVAPLRVT
jgi:hypothetical protein